MRLQVTSGSTEASALEVKFFGQYLIDEGEIDDAQLEQALEVLEEVNVRIDHLAVRAGYLTREQADRVYSVQREVNTQFCELAQAMDMMTMPQVLELLQEQRQTRLYIGEALVQAGALDADRLSQLLDVYKRDQAAHLVRPRMLPDALRCNPLIENVINALPVVALRLARMQLKLIPPAHWDGESSEPFAVMIRPTPEIQIGFAATRELAFRLAEKMLRRELTEVSDAQASSAVAEFLNILINYATADIEETGVEIQPEPPTSGRLPARGYVFELLTTCGTGQLIADVR